MNKRSKPKSRSGARDLKSELVGIAVGILESEGADALSLRDVAKAAGVSHMAPYRHFDSKNALLAAVAETGFSDLVSSIDTALSGASTAALKSRAIGFAYIRFARRRPALFRLMFGPHHTDVDQFPNLAEAVQAARNRLFRAVSLLDQDAAKGESENAETIGIAIWSLVHGLANLLIDGRIDMAPEPDAEEKLVNEVLDIIGRAVSPDLGE